jgi:hypothetical protein
MVCVIAGVKVGKGEGVSGIFGEVGLEAAVVTGASGVLTPPGLISQAAESNNSTTIRITEPVARTVFTAACLSSRKLN